MTHGRMAAMPTSSLSPRLTAVLRGLPLRPGLRVLELSDLELDSLT